MCTGISYSRISKNKKYLILNLKSKRCFGQKYVDLYRLVDDEEWLLEKLQDNLVLVTGI